MSERDSDWENKLFFQRDRDYEEIMDEVKSAKAVVIRLIGIAIAAVCVLIIISVQ